MVEKRRTGKPTSRERQWENGNKERERHSFKDSSLFLLKRPKKRKATLRALVSVIYRKCIAQKKHRNSLKAFLILLNEECRVLL